MVIDENGPPCQGHCPNHGCLESLASAAGVRAAAAQIAEQRPGGTLARAVAADEPVEVRVVIDGALDGDRDCIDALAIVGRHLGVGIANYVNIFNPDVVVVGGGIMAAGEILLGWPGGGRAAGAAAAVGRGRGRRRRARKRRGRPGRAPRSSCERRARRLPDPDRQPRRRHAAAARRAARGPT